MDFCPELLVKDRPDVAIIWMAAVDPVACRREKKYKTFDLTSTMQYLRTFMHGNQPPTIPGADTPMLALFLLDQLKLGVCRVLTWNMEDLYHSVLASHKQMRRPRVPDIDLPPPLRRQRITLLPDEVEIGSDFEEAIEDVDDLERPSPPPLLPEEELNVSDFFLEPLPHTVPVAEVTIQEVDIPQAATPPCNHDHEQDVDFQMDFGQHIPVAQPLPAPPSPSTSSVSDFEVPPPPPPPTIRRRSNRPIQRPLRNLEEILANLVPLPVEELLGRRPLVDRFLRPEQLFPEVDELVWRDMHGMLMPFFPIVQPEPEQQWLDHPEPEQQHLDQPMMEQQHLDQPEPEQQHLDQPEPEQQHLDQPEPEQQHLDQPEPEQQHLDQPEPEQQYFDQPDMDLPEQPSLDLPAEEPRHRISVERVIKLIWDYGHDAPDSPIAFHQLVPPSVYTRIGAACIFSVLLELHTSRLVRLEQEGPDAEIYIHDNGLMAQSSQLL